MTARDFAGILHLHGRLAHCAVAIRRRPQAIAVWLFHRLRSVGSSLWILISSIRFSIPKSVNAITPSSADPVDPYQAVFGLHFGGDVEQPILVLTEFFGDLADRRDVGDFVDVHGQAARAKVAWTLCRPVPRQQFIEPVRGMGGDAREDVGEPGLRIDAIHLAP